MSEQIKYDQVIEKFFKKGQVPSDEYSDWDYVVISYLLDGELVLQETELSPEMSDLFNEPDDTLEIGESLAISDSLSTQTVEDKNWTATGSKVDSEPSMHNEEGWAGFVGEPMDYQNVGKQDKIFDLPFHYVLEPDKKDLLQESTRPKAVNVPASTVSQFGKWTRTDTEPCEICDGFKGKIFDLAKKRRPTPPSEGKGFTTSHPNCHCYWEPVENPRDETKKSAVPAKLDLLTNLEKKHVYSINRKIGQKAKDHTLHTIFQDGKLSKRTRGTNPMKEIKEALVELHGQFNWFTQDYLAKIHELDKSVGGKFILVRASAETITDHRSEGEPYRRLLKGDELMQLTRTGIGKSTDINHLGKEYEVDSLVLDAEFDPMRKESQMLVHLKDPEIIHFIETGQISSVSINAGAPRRMDTECDTGECFVVPTGLILGELDGIAFTWVVDDPAGVVWRGKYIPKATAGVKTTRIEII
tara:strand:+ start:1815 stop:3224 length:1410 start_codon:yes stop_codon:yes gene_type:complete